MKVSAASRMLLLLLLCSTLLDIHHASATGDCGCFCMSGCKAEIRWATIGRGNKVCICDCRCPPLQQQQPSPPLPTTPKPPPAPVQQPPATPKPPPPPPTTPPAHQTPSSPKPPTGYYPYQPPSLECISISVTAAQCVPAIVSSTIFADVDLGKTCCHALRQAKNCDYVPDYPSIFGVDLNQVCKNHH